MVGARGVFALCALKHQLRVRPTSQKKRPAFDGGQPRRLDTMEEIIGTSSCRALTDQRMGPIGTQSMP
jgi:hypothetical protein